MSKDGEKKYLRKLCQILANESGQGMVEYGLIIALLAIVMIVVLKALGISIDDVLYRQIQDGIETVVDGLP